MVVVSDQQRGVIIYGHGVDAVAEALLNLAPQYMLTDHVVLESGQVPVLRRRHAAEADAVRDAAPDSAWLVVELYLPGVATEHACDPLLSLNASKVDPQTAARAIDQPDLVTWHEIINPIRVTTVDGRPVADDYGNIKFTVPDGHRMVAHAVKDGGKAPECLQNAERVLPSHDLWALILLRNTEACQVCSLRHA